MKKRIVLMLAGLLLCSALAGCGQTDANSSGAVPAGEMQLAPMQLSDEQYSVLSLADIGVREFIAYEYQTDENLRCITTIRYILNDALEWEPADSGSGRTYGDAPPPSPIGTIALTDKGGGQGFTHVLRERGESSTGYTSSVYCHFLRYPAGMTAPAQTKSRLLSRRLFYMVYLSTTGISVVSTSSRFFR